jgi:hypothetical protein
MIHSSSSIFSLCHLPTPTRASRMRSAPPAALFMFRQLQSPPRVLHRSKCKSDFETTAFFRSPLLLSLSWSFLFSGRAVFAPSPAPPLSSMENARPSVLANESGMHHHNERNIHSRVAAPARRPPAAKFPLRLASAAGRRRWTGQSQLQTGQSG